MAGFDDHINACSATGASTRIPRWSKTDIAFFLVFFLVGGSVVGCTQQDAGPQPQPTLSRTATTAAFTDSDAQNSKPSDDELDGDSPPADETDATVDAEQTNDSDVLQVSTTANPEIESEVNRNGTSLIEAWWFASSGETYTSLANRMEEQNLITTAFAIEWRNQGEQPVQDLTAVREIVRMWAVRVAKDNATFQVASRPIGSDNGPETLTFLEFVLEDGYWKVTDIQ